MDKEKHIKELETKINKLKHFKIIDNLTEDKEVYEEDVLKLCDLVYELQEKEQTVIDKLEKDISSQKRMLELIELHLRTFKGNCNEVKMATEEYYFLKNEINYKQELLNIYK